MKIEHIISYHRDGNHLVLRKLPLWLRITIEAFWFVDRLTRHRLCMSDIGHKLHLLEDRKAADLHIPLSDDLTRDVRRFLWNDLEEDE